MEGGDGGDVQTGGFLQQGLDLGAVLAHDVEVVAARLLDPGAVLGDGPEGAEAVGGEQDLLRALIADHDLRPVDHGGHDEGQAMPAQGEGVPLLDSSGGIGAGGVELGQHLDGLGAGHQLHVRVPLRQGADAPGVVRLQVLDHQVVGLPPGQGGLQLLQPLPGPPLVHGVHHGHLLVQDHIGVVGDPVGHRVLALKQVDVGIVHPHIADGVGQVHINHWRSSFLTGKSGRKGPVVFYPWGLVCLYIILDSTAPRKRTNADFLARNGVFIDFLAGAV